MAGKYSSEHVFCILYQNISKEKSITLNFLGPRGDFVIVTLGQGEGVGKLSPSSRSFRRGIGTPCTECLKMDWGHFKELLWCCNLFNIFQISKRYGFFQHYIKLICQILGICNVPNPYWLPCRCCTLLYVVSHF